MALEAHVLTDFLGFPFIVRVLLSVWDAPGKLCEYCLKANPVRMRTGYPFIVQVEDIRVGGAPLDPSSPAAYEVTKKTLIGLEHGIRVCPDHYHLHKIVIRRVHKIW